MDASLTLQSSHGTMADQELDEEEESLGSLSSSFSVGGSLSSTSTTTSTGSPASDLMDDATSLASSSSPPSEKGPLYELSSLISQLPIKRGLSKHFQGKSQSFASLSSVRCLEDLVKQERPCRKKLKPSKSYGGGLDTQKYLSPKSCSRAITKKPSRGCLSAINARKQGFWGSRPPVPPPPPPPGQRSIHFSSQTLLFA